MKTDKWFYELFLSQPGMLAELVPGIEVDWEFTYSAPVVKEKEFRLDGVFVPMADDPHIPIVFAEAQMQTDENFYRRYFAEVFLYLEQYQVSRSWCGLLILGSRRQRFGPELPYERLLDQQVTRLYLSDLKRQQGLSANLALLQLLVLNQEQAANIGRSLLQSADTEVEFERRLTLIETILANKFPDLTKEIIMQVLDLKVMDLTQSRFYQQIIQEGLEQGLQREVQLVLRLLERRVGRLSDQYRSVVLGLLVSQLEDLAEALLDFEEVADLEDWLTQRSLLPNHPDRF
jgi:predicted transposase/invertase (TIGR01784 family)